MTLGGQTPRQQGLTHRRPDASDVRDGVGDRKSPSGDQPSGGGHLHVAGTRPHPFQPIKGVEMDWSNDGDERSGRRSSATMGNGLGGTEEGVGYGYGFLRARRAQGGARQRP